MPSVEHFIAFLMALALGCILCKHTGYNEGYQQAMRDIDGPGHFHKTQLRRFMRGRSKP